MDFNQLISEKLHSLFTECGLEITEQLRNIVRYESKTLHVSLAYNERENSNNFWLGSKLSNDFVEMDDQVMKEFFDSDLQLKHLSQENFVNNIFKFFTYEGKECKRQMAWGQILKDLEEVLIITSLLQLYFILEILDSHGNVNNYLNFKDVLL